MVEGQMSMFDGKVPFRFTKPVRLIELFAGYGSQCCAMKELGVKFESWRICEWAVKSIQAYKDMHANTDCDYCSDLEWQSMVESLHDYGISANYNEPMTMKQICRLSTEKVTQIFNNIWHTKNLVNVQLATAGDLDICNTDEYDYVLTYSFPCQDLSKAGKGAGMAKGSGTRSGMLWEVERILDECQRNNTLPKVLLMENVPDVIGSKNIEHFAYWVNRLEKMGYKCYWQVLNAKDYGIPQNRERCFMVSILGDYLYEFPKPIKLEKRLKDLLENDVDEKFYLSDKAIEGAIKTSFCTGKIENKLPKDGICGTLMARDYKDPRWVAEPQLIELTSNQSQGNRVYDPNGLSVTLSANGGGRGAKTGLYAVDDSFVAKRYAEFVQENGYVPEMFNPYNRVEITDVAPTQTTNCGSSASSATVLVKEETLKRQLCNELIASGRVQENDVIRHSYTRNRLNNGDKNMGRVENHEGLAPTLDTRCDCLGVVVNIKNKRVRETAANLDPTIDGQYMDTYNRTNKPDICGTLLAGMDANQRNIVYVDYRIRKLTPRECFRLMGVRDCDFEKVCYGKSLPPGYYWNLHDRTMRKSDWKIMHRMIRQRHQSNASLYHLAGDSIVVPVLVAIFGKMVDGFDFEKYIQSFYQQSELQT